MAVDEVDEAATDLLYDVRLVKLLRSETGFVLDKLEGVPVHSL